MDFLHSVFNIIGESTLVVYFIALMFSINRYRVVNSTVLSISVVFLMESLMRLVRDPLLGTASREVWYGSWVAMSVLTVYLLYKSHQVLRINLAKITNLVAITYLASAGTQALRYIDREHFDGVYLESVYYIAVHTINISLALLILFTVFRDKKERLVGLYV